MQGEQVKQDILQRQLVFQLPLDMNSRLDVIASKQFGCVQHLNTAQIYAERNGYYND